MHLNKPEKPKAVSFTDTVAYPRAVVVVSGDAVVTVFAVLGSERLLNMTDRTILVLDEEDNIFVII